MYTLLPFQTIFLSQALRPNIDMAVLSIPRGNGKSSLSGYLLSRILDPEDELFQAGKESILLAGSLEQARICFKFARDILEPRGGYSFTDSHTRIGIRHKESNTRLRVISSSAKTAMGIVGCPLLIGDECGSWEVNNGRLMFDAISTAQGKPGSPLKVIFISTIAPSDSGWWPELVERGSHDSVYVQKLQADPERWDSWPEIRRCNPLTKISPAFRAKLIEERNEARKDSRLKARFLSFRLNVPTADESTVLLTTEDWKLMLPRPIPERKGSPIVGIDLGGGRAWSSAVAVWRSGRTEAIAMAPGIPSIRDQEKRDRVPKGLYQKLVDSGQLVIAEGLRVPKVETLVKAMKAKWGAPRFIICDRFKLNALRDAVNGFCPIVDRVTRWSEATEDVGSIRRGVKDGPLTVAPCSQSLLLASLAVATVENDKQGSCRLIKRGTNNEARDDVAVAWTLAAAARDRLPKPRPAPRHFVLE